MYQTLNMKIFLVRASYQSLKVPLFSHFSGIFMMLYSAKCLFTHMDILWPTAGFCWLVFGYRTGLASLGKPHFVLCDSLCLLLHCICCCFVKGVWAFLPHHRLVRANSRMLTGLCWCVSIRGPQFLLMFGWSDVVIKWSIKIVFSRLPLLSLILGYWRSKQ